MSIGIAQSAFAQQATSEETITQEVPVVQPKPEVPVDQPKPEVAVTQPKPEVAVTQPKPEAPVAQPKPAAPAAQPKPAAPAAQPKPAAPAVQPKPTIKINEWSIFKDEKGTISVNLANSVETTSKSTTFDEIIIYWEKNNKLLGGKVVVFKVAADKNNVLIVTGTNGTFEIVKQASTAAAGVVDYVEMALANKANRMGKNIKINFK
jgi:hypothetical protein